MKTVYGSAVTPNGICGFGYVDEGLPKDQALAKLKAEMQNNPAFQLFLSTLPEEKRRAVVKEIVDAVIGDTAGGVPPALPSPHSLCSLRSCPLPPERGPAPATPPEDKDML